MDARTREIISKATLLLVAAVLLWASVSVGRFAYRTHGEENAYYEEVRRGMSAGMNVRRREARVASLLWIVSGTLGAGGLFVVGCVIAPNLVLRRRPPVLWENPEPGHTPRHF